MSHTGRVGLAYRVTMLAYGRNEGCRPILKRIHRAAFASDGGKTHEHRCDLARLLERGRASELSQRLVPDHARRLQTPGDFFRLRVNHLFFSPWLSADSSCSCGSRGTYFSNRDGVVWPGLPVGSRVASDLPVGGGGDASGLPVGSCAGPGLRCFVVSSSACCRAPPFIDDRSFTDDFLMMASTKALTRGETRPDRRSLRNIPNASCRPSLVQKRWASEARLRATVGFLDVVF